MARRFTVGRVRNPYDPMPWALFDAKSRPVAGIQLAVACFSSRRLAQECAKHLNAHGGA